MGLNNQQVQRTVFSFQMSHAEENPTAILRWFIKEKEKSQAFPTVLLALCRCAAAYKAPER